MDQGGLSGAYRRLEADLADLGNEPPLSADGGGGLVDRRRVSVQWLSGTILTGLCGAVLMGGAVFASLDGQTTFASAPEHVETALRGALAGGKTDQLPRFTEPRIARQMLRVPTITHVRNRELIRTRPYTRVSGDLSLTVSDLTAHIPAFNPQKLIAQEEANADNTPAAEPDAEVSFVTCDFVPVRPKGKVAPTVCNLNSLLPKVKTLLQLNEVIARVRDVADAAQANSPPSGDADLATAGLKLGYAAEDDADPYVGFAAQIIPENVTLLPKTTNGAGWNEHAFVVKKGDTVASILHELGATADEIKGIAAVLGPFARPGGLKEGQRLRILAAAVGLGHTRPLRVIVAGDSGVEAAAALSDTADMYVPVDISNIDTDVAAATSEDQGDHEGSGVDLYRSLYETALRNNIPPAVIEEMVRIFAYDVDFQRNAQPGDAFDVVYAGDKSDEGRDEVRYVSLTLDGETKEYYRYRTADDGAYDYYDETGRSAKKFLVRKPVPIGSMTSGFGWRVHPVLHYMRMHTGVDWAAPRGTAIFAAGNGVIEEIGLKGGYGKYVRIRHADGYDTGYGHLAAYARGLHVGSRVRQGQVIGFIGSSGLATGPHLHFEILINNRFVNPMRIKLPRGRVLKDVMLVQFERDRKQLDAVLAHASREPARVAQAR